MDADPGSQVKIRNEEWKTKMKLIKQEKKMRNQQRKEEELRRKMTGPKDSRVVVIDRATLDRLNDKKSDNNDQGTSNFRVEDFPELKSLTLETTTPKTPEKTVRLVNSSQSNKSWSQMVETVHWKTSESFPSLDGQTRVKRKDERAGVPVPGTRWMEQAAVAGTRGAPVIHTPLSESSHVPSVMVAKPLSHPPAQPTRNLRKKKRKDPIVVDLSAVLKIGIQDKKNLKQQKRTILGSKYRKRTEIDNNLSGNMLDSSNPKRNKGKHRENRKKRLTKLKTLVVRERILKRIFTGNHEEPEIDLKEEIKMYLNTKDVNKHKTVSRAWDKIAKETGEGETTVKQCVEESQAVMKEAHSEFSQKSDETRTQMEGDGMSVKNKTTLEEDVGAVNKEKFRRTKKKSKKVADKEEWGEGKSRQQVEQKTTFQHSNRFREYCDNVVTPTLNQAVKDLLKELVYLQDRLYARDPIKAQARRRLVCGFHEANKQLKLKRVKMLVVAPDLEKLESPGSVNHLVEQLKVTASSLNVPCVFALDRRKLGYATLKKVPVSVISIINVEGVEERFQKVMDEVKIARDLLRRPDETELPEVRVAAPTCDSDDITREVVSSFLSVLTDNAHPGKPHQSEEVQNNPFLAAIEVLLEDPGSSFE